ncbi:DNA repair protein RecO [Candidatus Parcubacteria bacterium]|nr:DNA repair protein RecO [Candidatus Parcubacteria bacterium]
MATLHSTLGIVLSRRDFREADRIYSVLTPTRGKLELLARGGHKPLAKLTPHLELAAEADLLFVHGRTFLTLAGVERRRQFMGTRTTLGELLLIQNSLSLVDLAVRPEERDPLLYALVVNWLAFAGSTGALSDERGAFLLGSFLLKLMSACGYRPELCVCLACRSPVAPGGYRWHALKGGVVCEACAVAQEDQWFHARRIEDATLKLLRFALVEPFGSQLRPTLCEQDSERFHEALESYLITHFPVIPSVSIRGACVTTLVAA